MIIRAAQPEDTASLVPLFEEWGHGLEEAELLSVLARWQETPLAELFVASSADRLAGMVGIYASPSLARPGRTARIAGLAVSPEHRRSGVGTSLMRAAETTARTWGCDQVELTSSRSRVEAHAFYPALGYVDQSDRQARYVKDV